MKKIFSVLLVLILSLAFISCNSESRAIRRAKRAEKTAYEQAVAEYEKALKQHYESQPADTKTVMSRNRQKNSKTNASLFRPRKGNKRPCWGD